MDGAVVQESQNAEELWICLYFLENLWYMFWWNALIFIEDY